jgi:alanine dehydrogenase
MEITIVKETKTKERRVALVPRDVKEIISQGHNVFVENNAGIESGHTNELYLEVGAKIISTEEAKNKHFIVKVKEPNIEDLKENQTIFGFLHIEKGQNPELLHALLNKKITAYAYEEFRDPTTKIKVTGQGFEAGVVGMFEGLRTYGKILEKRNLNNPFKALKSIWDYKNKEEAYLELRKINPREVEINVSIVGYGNVSKGSQEVLAQMSCPANILKEENTLRTKLFNQNFAYIWKHLPKIDILINAIIWRPGNNRVITKEDLELMKNNSLIVDISCDLAGGIESCIPTSWENPTYEVKTNNNKSIHHFCVDNLPSAIAQDSSRILSAGILPFILKVAEGKELQDSLMTKNGQVMFTQH